MASTSRIGGDFDFDALEAFRAAYADQLQTPEDQDIHALNGLPTNTISNTSPWIEHTGLWKYPSGKGPEEDLQKPFNVNDYLSQEELDENLEETMSDEEIDNLINEVLDDEEDE
jgi:hypothetical protein